MCIIFSLIIKHLLFLAVCRRHFLEKSMCFLIFNPQSYFKWAYEKTFICRNTPAFESIQCAILMFLFLQGVAMGRGGKSGRRRCAPAPDQAAGEAGAMRGDEGGENEEAWRRGGRAGSVGASPTTPSLTAALRWRSRRGPVRSGRIRWEITRKRWI